MATPTIEDFTALVETHLEQGSNSGDIVRDIRAQSQGVFGLREADHCYSRCLERLAAKGNTAAQEKIDYRKACRS